MLLQPALRRPIGFDRTSANRSQTLCSGHDSIRSGALSLVWSAIMDVENAANPDINRKVAVGDWQKLGFVDISISQRVE